MSIEFEALTAETVTSNIPWDFIVVQRRFEEVYCPIFRVEEYEGRAAIEHADCAFLFYETVHDTQKQETELSEDAQQDYCSGNQRDLYSGGTRF
jgi:hypothetical protein